ncbi:hypothetical protein J6X15_04150 [Candidatus Saccharibacteria bacterium]|nr:hypothetical protein [Candidatus Saccharibacteria bacterium]
MSKTRKAPASVKLAHEFKELAGKASLPKEEKRRLNCLSRTLTARGLDPKHSGLTERAMVLDNLCLVNDYIKAARRAEHSDKVTARAQEALDKMIQRLHDVGLDQTGRKHLQEIVRQIGENQRAAERLKHTNKTRAPHRNAALEEEIEELAAASEDDVEMEDFEYATASI